MEALFLLDSSLVAQAIQGSLGEVLELGTLCVP